jgi:hypothetical protein
MSSSTLINSDIDRQVPPAPRPARESADLVQTAPCEGWSPQLRTVVLLAIAIHVGVALWLNATMNLWQDELFTVYAIEGSWQDTYIRARDFELQPPVYYMLLHAWRTISETPFWLRSFSTLATAGAVIFGAAAIRRWAGNRAAGWGALLLASNPIMLWAATEMRCYALVLLLTSLLWWLLLRGFLSDRGTLLDRAAYTFVALMSLYTHYYLGFTLVAAGAAVLLTWRAKTIFAYGCSMLVVGVLFLPQALLVRAQVSDHVPVDARDEIRSPLGGAKQVYWRMQDYLLPFDWDGAWSQQLVQTRDIAFRVGGVGVLIALMIGARKKQLLMLLAAISVLSICFLLLRIRLGPDFFLSRYTISLLLPVLSAMLVAATCMRRAVFLTALGLLALVANVSSAVAEYRTPYKLGDWQRVSQLLREQAQPSEPIFAYINETVLPLRHYLGTDHRVVPLPVPMALDHYDPSTSEVESSQQLEGLWQRELKPGETFWLVMCHEQPFQGIVRNAEIVTDFLADRCQVLEMHEYLGSRVIHGQWKEESP